MFDLLKFYFHIEAGALSEALSNDIEGGVYDPVIETPLSDIFGPNGLLPLKIIPGNDPPIQESVTFHCLAP